MERRAWKWVSLALAVLAVPLAAPTCGGSSGLRAFSAGTLIIPMDVCHQLDNGSTLPGYCQAPNSTRDDGVLKAYGLVYFLIKHGVAVYWVVSPNKTAVDGIDMTLVGQGEPVQHYLWSDGGTVSFLGGGTRIDYRGGPFLIDGQDLPRVRQLLLTDPDFAQFKTAATIDIHQSTSSFQGEVARTMSGLPPTLALLNITGGDGINSLSVLTGYLTAAGLNFAGAGGTAAGPHGAIYDALVANDFLPYPDGGTALFANGYKLLWAPHWSGPGSQGVSSAQLTQILQTLGTFVDRGGDLFAECASIGTIEGAWTYPNSTVNAAFGAGDPSSQSLSTAGLFINSPGSPLSAPYDFRFPASPFAQVGDFTFTALGGYINDFGRRTTPLLADGGIPSSYVANAQELLTEKNTSLNNGMGFDVFALVPNKAQDPNKGTVVYLGGHSYNGQTAGTRLVLNSLFNLSATCVDPNTPCNTGLLGVCAAGVLKCNGSGQITCAMRGDAGYGPEICDGLDNDCNGLIDDGLPPIPCYDGPDGSQRFPPCQRGQAVCVGGSYGTCQGEVVPTGEVCNGIDDDCNGTIDLLPDGGPIQVGCYDGPLGTENVGICHGGLAACNPADGGYGACVGEQLPESPQCSSTIDHDCNGSPDTQACQCASGQTQSCYSGPAGTAGVGACRAGTQTCVNSQWGPCTGEVVPSPEKCDGTDDNCNGIIGDGCITCSDGDQRSCWDGPDGGVGRGVCQAGVEVCAGNTWGPCVGEVLPGPELCDGKDNNCDDQVDDGATCPGTEVCINGTCVPSGCGGELSNCGEGFVCQAGHCALAPCGDGGVCPAGQRCQGGRCVDPCAGVRCGSGSFCAGGQCVAGGCYDVPCTSGQVCQLGQCVADPCAGVTCPAGDFCRGGYCVPSCVFVHCSAGQVCGPDGQCVAPACAPGSCASGVCLADGGCGTDPCQEVSCALGQVCTAVGGAAVCVADPCAGVHCPVGSCVGGQCQRSGSGSTGGTGTSGASSSSGGETSGSGGSSGSSGGANGPHKATAKSGCGCGAEGGVSPLWLFFGWPLLLRRRRYHAIERVARWAPITLAAAAAFALALAGCSSGRSPKGAGASSGGAGSTSGSSGGSSGGCAAGQSHCGQGCVDLLSSTQHCGDCAIACAAGEICDQGYCGPATSPNPVIDAISPDQAPLQARVDVTVTGERFQSGAQVHLSGGGANDRSVSTDFTSASTLVAHLDLSGLTAGPAALRVVNPGRLISNAAAFTLGGGAAAPTLASVSPPDAQPGGPVSLAFVGTLFDATTAIHANGPGMVDRALATQVQDSTHCTATFDLGGASAGNYQLWAANGTSAQSNPLTFVVHSVTPTLAQVTPASAATGSQVALTAQGSGFDPTTVLHFQTAPGAASPLDRALTTTFIRVDEVTVSSSSPLDLTGIAPGSYQVVAENENGAKLSGPVTFGVISNPPRATSVDPSSGRQGSTVPITVHGQGFDGSSVVHLLVGSSDTPQATTYVDPTQVRCSLDLNSVPPGAGSLAVINAGGLASNALRFTVASNQALLSQVSPGGGVQGTQVSLTLTGSNFESGAQAHLTGNGQPDAALATAFSSATQLLVSGLDLTPFPPGQYALGVDNPNSSPSAPLTFTVEPGTPTLSGVNPTSAQTNTVASLTLTGSFFAPGAVVHASSSQVPDTALATTFHSQTQLTVDNFNLSNVPPDTFTITVVNPGPLTSNAQSFTVAP